MQVQQECRGAAPRHTRLPDGSFAPPTQRISQPARREENDVEVSIMQTRMQPPVPLLPSPNLSIVVQDEASGSDRGLQRSAREGDGGGEDQEGRLRATHCIRGILSLCARKKEGWRHHTPCAPVAGWGATLNSFS